MKKYISIVLVSLILISGFVVFAQSNTCKNIKPKEIKINESKLKEDLTWDDLRELNGGRVNTEGQSFDHFFNRHIIKKEKFPLGVEMRYFIYMVQETNGVFSTRKIRNEKDAVYALMSVRSYLEITDTSFACTEKIISKDKKAFFLRQLHNGVAVINGGYYIEAAKDGTPICVRGRLVRNIETDIDLNPKISQKEALAIAKNNLPPDKDFKVRRSQLFIDTLYDDMGKREHRLIWRFLAFDDDLTDYGVIIFVDAMTGKITEKSLARVREYYSDYTRDLKEWADDIDK